MGKDVQAHWAGLVALLCSVGPSTAYLASGEVVRIAAGIRKVDVVRRPAAE